MRGTQPQRGREGGTAGRGHTLSRATETVNPRQGAEEDGAERWSVSG